MRPEVRSIRLRTGVSLACLIEDRQRDSSGAGNLTDTPLLLVHAWTESRGSFDRLRPLLAGRRVVAPDLRGHGDSDKTETGYSLPEVADDLAALLDALALPKAVVIGSSSGGYVGQQLAVSHPERVAALVLIGSPLSLHGRAPFADEVDQLPDPVPESWVRDSLSWFTLFQPVPKEYLEDRVRDGSKVPARIWKSSLAGLGNAVPPTEAGEILAPTLILWGGRDDLLSRQDEETLAQRIPQSRLRIYEEAGHVLLWENPEQISSDVNRFLADIPV
ncbi:alpha/beta fold hydrolase [Arthrobacter rhizosphaerae]|uniref:alpha/beta fold hydrolase n=1 Tax=Arthrobacter rhizosphaerae TaxID=2855490 RepID=UPI001FF505FB|nr:alpha/beta hydrolase [Arthrobacter rhizosphaerae]